MGRGRGRAGASRVGVEGLAGELRERGTKLREWTGDERTALIYERIADELEEPLHSVAADELT